MPGFHAMLSGSLRATTKALTNELAVGREGVLRRFRCVIAIPFACTATVRGDNDKLAVRAYSALGMPPPATACCTALPLQFARHYPQICDTAEGRRATGGRLLRIPHLRFPSRICACSPLGRNISVVVVSCDILLWHALRRTTGEQTSHCARNLNGSLASYTFMPQCLTAPSATNSYCARH